MTKIYLIFSKQSSASLKIIFVFLSEVKKSMDCINLITECIVHEKNQVTLSIIVFLFFWVKNFLGESELSFQANTGWRWSVGDTIIVSCRIPKVLCSLTPKTVSIGIIVEGNNNQLYIDTDGGLYIMDMTHEMFTKIAYQTDDRTDLVSAINALYIDNNKNLWIGTMQQDIFLDDTVEKLLKKINVDKYDLDNNATWKIYGDRSNTVWVVHD